MKKGLGKGLEALFEDVTGEELQSVSEIDINLIDRDHNQPRKQFKQEEIDELAQSIRINGIIQPLIVRRVGNTYTIIAGERRWRAAKSIKLKKVPVVVRDVTDKQILEFALIENIQRKDLNAIEEAKGFKRLQEEYKMTQEEISKSIGKSRVSITNKLRLLKLDNKIQEYIIEGKLSEGHGKKEKEEVLNLEEYQFVENELAKKFGTKVKITRSSKKGRIIIEYYSLDGLNRIIDIIKR